MEKYHEGLGGAGREGSLPAARPAEHKSLLGSPLSGGLALQDVGFTFPQAPVNPSLGHSPERGMGQFLLGYRAGSFWASLHPKF